MQEAGKLQSALQTPLDRILFVCAFIGFPRFPGMIGDECLPVVSMNQGLEFRPVVLVVGWCVV